MSKQTSLDSFFQYKAKPRPVLGNNLMENKNNFKRQSLSLSRSHQPSKSPKISSAVKYEVEVISLSSSSEDENIPINTPSARPSHYNSLSTEGVNLLTTPNKSLSPTKENKTSNRSFDSSQTILYNLSSSTSQTPPVTPNKTPKCRKSNEKFFSPTKKRLVTYKSPIKRKLQFKEENYQQTYGTNEVKSIQPVRKLQDDKSLFLLSIIKDYLKNDALKHLLDVSSEDLLSRCIHIAEPGIRIVCRLFWRQTIWYRTEELQKIASDKDKYDISNFLDVLKSLVDNNLLSTYQSNDENNWDIEDYVKLLKLPELQQICKELKLKVRTKQEAVDALRKYSQRSSISNYFNGKIGNNSNRVLNMLKSKTGNCYKLSEVAKTALYKLYVLMYLGMDYTNIREKRLELILLHDKLNRETYPIEKTMVVDDASVVFQNRDQFNRYLEAHIIYENYRTSVDIEEKRFLVSKSYKLYKTVLQEDMIRYKSLPPWLRRFTPAYIYVRILESGVQELKKSKKINEYLFAIDILDLLLGQIVFRQHKKSEWYAEKALILHKHLDRSEQAARTLLEGFAADLSEEAKDAMRPRAKLIANQRNIELDESFRETLRNHSECGHLLEGALPADHVYKAPMDNYNQKGKLKFEAHTEDGRLILTAEDYCILHYTRNGDFTHGEHWEGRMVITMFFLLFWDIIYTKPLNISGIFLNHFQRHPLDMYSENFYNNRKTLIDDRLIFIEECTEDMVVEMMQNRWEERPEYEVSDICHSLGWVAVESVARCLGPRALSAICRRLATNYGYTHSGFPDLTLWNIHTKTIKFVEVKTDADKPSTKQLQWLQYLTSHNMAAGFCYVGVNTTRCKARSRDNVLS